MVELWRPVFTIHHGTPAIGVTCATATATGTEAVTA
jgi:hypothetical protein